MSETWFNLSIVIVSGGTAWLVLLERRYSQTEASLRQHEAECLQYRKNQDERYMRLIHEIEGVSTKLDRMLERVMNER